MKYFELSEDAIPGSKYIVTYDPAMPGRSFGMYIDPYQPSGLNDDDWQLKVKFKFRRKLAKNRLKKANKYTHYV